jgi:hypothetical protein
MNNIKFTAALKVICGSLGKVHNPHVTIAFCDVAHGDKVQTATAFCNVPGKGVITAVKYWSGPDITVLLIDSGIVRMRHQYYTKNGYKYEGHEFNPHITLGKGNQVEDFEHLLGKELLLGEEYVRLLDVNVYANKRNAT